jgi:hypothetical protein
MEVVDIPNEELDTYLNKIIIENTPLGNVLMHWDNKRGAFVYYSDHSIPYKFLETVARKYVVKNNCKKIYVDMEEEIKKAEKKLEENRKEEEKKLAENNNTVVDKKNVFAKLKSYNRDTVKSNAVVLDSKNAGKKVNSNSNTNNITNSDKKYILKDNANRYSYEGKISNFQFLKKVDKSLVDKNYSMTFAEFKKIQLGK